MRYDPDQPLIFIHVPKTAGRSVRDVFQGWFGAGLIRHYFDEPTGRMPEIHDIDARHSRAAPVCVYGHFNRDRGFGVEHSYPRARQFVTILRDPFDMVTSHYYFLRRTAGNWQDRSRMPGGSLAAYLETTRPNMLNHFPRPVTAENYRDIVEEFFVDIGCTEALVPSLTRIAHRLGQRFDPASLPHRNRSDRDDQDAAVQSLRALFRDRNPVECAVYDYARARLAPPAQETAHARP